jgi:hypothetical protein
LEQDNFFQLLERKKPWPQQVIDATFSEVTPASKPIGDQTDVPALKNGG